MSGHDDFQWSAQRAAEAASVISGLRRDITSLKHELAGIAIFMQERDRLSDPGGPLFALVHGAVVTYILELEATA